MEIRGEFKSIVRYDVLKNDSPFPLARPFPRSLFLCRSRSGGSSTCDTLERTDRASERASERERSTHIAAAADETPKSRAQKLVEGIAHPGKH